MKDYSEAEKSINAKLPYSLHKAMKARAAELGKSVKDYLAGLIEEDLKGKE